MKRWIGFLAAGLVGALAGNTLFAVARADFGGSHGPRGFFRHHGDPDEVKRRAQVGVEVAFRMVGADAEQIALGKAIVVRRLEAAAGLHEQARANRERGVRALTGTDVDRAALEEVRQAQVALADEASRELTSALVELAEVLTPEQRTQLVQMAQRFHNH